METSSAIGDQERSELWKRLDAALPPAVAILRSALQQRVLTAPEDPLRNRMVRKLLVGHDTSLLVGQFECAASVLDNWPDFAESITTRDGADFDTALWPWLAEVRALRLLRDERHLLSATAIPTKKKQKTPDFVVHRKAGDGLAEVKLVTPNNNFDAIEEELEIARIRRPELFDRHLFILRTPDDRDFNLSQDPILHSFVEELGAAIEEGRTHVRLDTLAAEIEPCPEFALMGEGVGGLLDDDFRKHWLTPFGLRLAEKSHQALDQMQDYERQVDTTYAEKDLVIYYQEPAAGAVTLLLNDDMQHIRSEVLASLHRRDGGVVLSVRS